LAAATQISDLKTKYAEKIEALFRERLDAEVDNAKIIQRATEVLDSVTGTLEKTNETLDSITE